jgi:putative transposase
MARKARIHVPGIIQHIMAKGIEGRNLFVDDEDRQTFFSLLGDSIVTSCHRCYAWVLMNNHYHLLIRTSEEPPGIMMRRLNSKYARYFSKKYNRRGYLFQDRYKSIATQDQNYIEELVRYIHLNPIRAGFCRTIQELDRYPWSGHSVLMGMRKAPFQDTRTVLKRFGSSTARYRRYLEEGIASGFESDIIETLRKSNKGREDVRNAGCWVIGDPVFVRKALSSDANLRTRIARYQKEGWDVPRLAREVSKKLGIEPASIRRRTRDERIGDARKIFCYIGSKELSTPQSELGDYLGISVAGVWALASKGRLIMKKRGIEAIG